MPRCLIKLTIKDKSYFGEWSTVVDAPTSALMPLEKFKEWYLDRYGDEGRADIQERLMRVMQFGTSFQEPTSAEELIRDNRAGPNETELSRNDIIKDYAE